MALPQAPYGSSTIARSSSLKREYIGARLVCNRPALSRGGLLPSKVSLAAVLTDWEGLAHVSIKPTKSQRTRRDPQASACVLKDLPYDEAE
ncbi:protein of unknown function [Candidatus Filomicrobium marinum]|uniref:Uncharacterized protein n=1 Tax=Candidatus Filomicrobium marinum TaxID=1608628 RepID=A0A0D6JHI9_9HYPH|nr:protein of unknown function [Candidatus Filomicrobium marinum]CPR20454.1 protein of unknown function [Candidatus Filomicrobium marinum]